MSPSAVLVIQNGSTKLVNVKNQAKDKVRLDKINGRHCMVIELDDALIEVNGYDLKVPGVLDPDSPAPWDA